MWNSDAAYDSFMGRFSRRLAPVFADFAGVQRRRAASSTSAPAPGMLTRGARAARRRWRQRSSRRRRSPSRCAAASPISTSARRRAEQLPWEDGSFDVALAQLVVAFMDDAPAGVAEMARVANGRVAVCMWDLEGQELLASVNHVRERMGEEPTEPRRYRTAAEIEELVGPGAECATLDVEASYEDFEDYWSSLLGGAGPLGRLGRIARRRASRDGTGGADPRARRSERVVHAQGSLLGR